MEGAGEAVDGSKLKIEPFLIRNFICFSYSSSFGLLLLVGFSFPSFTVICSLTDFLYFASNSKKASKKFKVRLCGT